MPEFSVDILLQWLMTHGSLILFILLALGIVGLPVPDETLLVLSGVLISQQKLLLVPTVLAALAGSMLGITVSFVLGRTVGHFLLVKYGKWIGITQARLDYAHRWFEKMGKWLLVFGYFLPGVRHFTGIVAGLASLETRYFMLFAYTGATIWALLFLTLGYVFSAHIAEILAGSYHRFMLLFTVVVVLIAGAFYWKFRQS